MKLKAKTHKLVQIQDAFCDYYNNNLKNDFFDLEKERHHFLHSFWLRFVLFFSGGIIYLISLYSENCGYSDSVIKLFIMYVIIAYYICMSPVEKYKKMTKMRVMQKILKFWKDFSHMENLQVTKDIVRDSSLFGEFNATETDDNFSGRYKNTDVCISEQKVFFNGRKFSYMFFRGVFILLKLNKENKKRTIIRSKDIILPGGITGNWSIIFIFGLLLLAFLSFLCIGLSLFFEANYVGKYWSFLVIIAASIIPVVIFLFIYRRFMNLRGKNKLEDVILEDPEFVDKWRVYSDDQINARMILTPRFMEKIKYIKEYFYGNKLDCSFFGDKMLIAVYTTKDMFETTSIFSSSLKYKKMREVVSQMYSVFSIISEINKENENIYRAK